jgi:hypothetical protein
VQERSAAGKSLHHGAVRQPVERAMGRIGRTYPRLAGAQPLLAPVAPQRLLFVRRGPARRLPGFVWLSAFVSLVLLAWPSA